MAKCVSFGAKGPGFQSPICYFLGTLFSFFCLTFPICIMRKQVLALSHRIVVRTNLVSAFKGPLRVLCTSRSTQNQNICYLWGLATIKMLFHDVWKTHYI